jgi:hypothetical protein
VIGPIRNLGDFVDDSVANALIGFLRTAAGTPFSSANPSW